MGLFLDLLHVPVRATNDALEGLYKALSDGHNHDPDGVWKPHESILVRRLIELFTKRGLDRLAGVKQGLADWYTGKNYKASPVPAPLPAGMMQRWSPAELELAKLYLEALPPALWTLDDHMLCIDLVVQTYLPADHMQPEAEWLSTRAGLMGKVQANMDKAATAKQADALLAGLPSTVAAAATQFTMKPAQVAQLDFARVRAVESVRALSESVRHKMRGIVLQDLEQRAAGAVPAGTSSLETKLLDAFGDLNRDWRRIAVTEAGEAQLQGMVASVKPGTRLKRVEQYDGACSFCRSIDGRVVTVVDAASASKNGDTEVWIGKNNIGRSASPKKRVGNVLMDREDHEMWWIPAGLAHPNCRGRWIVLPDQDPDDDPDFAAWLSENLK